MILNDAIELSSPRFTKDGYLAAEALVARTGIQEYFAGEMGIDGDPMRIIRVYRPADEVFHADAMASYAHRPVTVDHPSQQVDASNWQEYARGQTGGEVLRDKEYVRIPLLLMDAGAIKEWKDGKRELSMGYSMDLDLTDGVTPAGEQFDAIQRNMRMNHLAFVAQARGGSKLKLGDKRKETLKMSDIKLTTVMVGGLSVSTTDAGAQAISKISTDLDTARTSLADAEKNAVTAKAIHDAAMATKDAEIDSLKNKQLSDADIDKLVNDRADLIATAKQIADKDYTGQSADDIRKSAVVASLGADSVTDRSPAYIHARFDILAEDANKDGVRKVIKGKPADNVSAYDSYVDRIENAWKGNTEGSA